MKVKKSEAWSGGQEEKPFISAKLQRHRRQQDGLTEKNSEKRAKLRGIATHFEKFDFLFGVHLNVLIFCHTDNLSKPLQAVKMCVAQGQTVARQVVHTKKIFACGAILRGPPFPN